jgi:CHRD domain
MMPWAVRPVHNRRCYRSVHEGGTIMHKLLIRTAVTGLATAALLSLTPAAFAQAVNYKADLKAASQVPPNDSKGTGALTATYDPASKKLTYTVNYKDLSGPATAAHFHGPADAKTNAGVVVPVNGAVTSPIKGEATLTDAQAKDLADGKWYFNVHTAANKGGEIRGQVMKGM